MLTILRSVALQNRALQYFLTTVKTIADCTSMPRLRQAFPNSPKQFPDLSILNPEQSRLFLICPHLVRFRSNRLTFSRLAQASPRLDQTYPGSSPDLSPTCLGFQCFCFTFRSCATVTLIHTFPRHVHIIQSKSKYY